MTGSKTISTTLSRLRAGRRKGKSKTDLSKVRASVPYVWDGKSAEDQPLSTTELETGLKAYRRGRGRPRGSEKQSTTIRFDRDVLAAFRANGPGWQTRINAALREWLEQNAEA